MKPIDGKTLAAAIRADVKKAVAELPSPPGLGVLLVGDDPASRVYVNLKEKASAEAGVRTDIRRVPATVSDDDLEGIIRDWNADASLHGILIQLPLPPGHDTDRLIRVIDPAKDVDGFHPETVRRLLVDGNAIIAPVHEAVLRLIASTSLDPRGKAATVLANSDVFADPLIHLLQRAGFLTAKMYPDMLDGDVLRTSDVIVTAVGRPGFLGADLVKNGTIIIDVGTSKNEMGTVCGDADAASLTHIDGWLTPVPGGVGPMTVALLLKNVLELATRR